MFIIAVILISFAFSITGEELSTLMDNRNSPNDISSNMNMEIINKKGRKRTLKVKSVSKDNSKKQILWFLSPADDKGIAYLKIEHENRDDEIRLWLPAFKKIRRISSKKKGDSFMGSDLTYEDMTSRPKKDYSFLIIKEETIGDQNCYLLESKPKKGIKSSYSKHLTWVTKDTYLPIKEESYDNDGKLLKLQFSTPTRLIVTSTGVPLGPLNFLTISSVVILYADSPLILTILSPLANPALSEGVPGIGDITVI